MFLEYDWTFNVYRVRFCNIFTDWRGFRYFENLREARDILAETGNRLGHKTDSRTWEIV